MRQKLQKSPRTPAGFWSVRHWRTGAGGLISLALLILTALVITLRQRSSHPAAGNSSIPSNEQAVRIHGEIPANQNGGAELDEAIARFLDEQTPLAERIALAKRLARDGSPAAMSAMLKSFQSASPERQALLVQIIGQSGRPAVQAWLWSLLMIKTSDWSSRPCAA